MHAQIPISARRQSAQQREKECGALRGLLIGVAVVGILAIAAIQIIAGHVVRKTQSAFNEAGTLSKTVENLEMALENGHDPESLRRAAERLGFREAQPEQRRSITLQDAREANVQQNVEADGSFTQNG